MPCMCWYNPTDSEKREFKRLCSQLVDLIKELGSSGDPLNCTIKDAHELIDHLYNPKLCDKSKKD